MVLFPLSRAEACLDHGITTIMLDVPGPSGFFPVLVDEGPEWENFAPSTVFDVTKSVDVDGEGRVTVSQLVEYNGGGGGTVIGGFYTLDELRCPGRPGATITDVEFVDGNRAGVTSFDEDTVTFSLASSHGLRMPAAAGTRIHLGGHPFF